MLLRCGVGEDSWESLRLQGNPTSQSWRKSVLNIYWKDWCWSWNSNTLAIWFEELSHWRRPWCWERLKVGGEGDDSGWDGCMASPSWWTWVWASLEIGDGQGSLACCSPWGCKELDKIAWLNWTVLSIWKDAQHHMSLGNCRLKNQCDTTTHLLEGPKSKTPPNDGEDREH